jgi:hypothetical protein
MCEESRYSSVHGTLHMAAFFLAFLSLIAAALVFGRRFLRGREKGRAVYSIVSALAVPALMGMSWAIPAWAGVIVAMAGLVLFVWLAVAAVPFRLDLSEDALADSVRAST